MADTTYPIGRSSIEKVLPHRDPFLWVDRILECTPGAGAVGELDVRADLDLFRGHFPEHPVLPGVIIMEALAQVAAYSILVDPAMAGNIGFLVGIDKAKFRGQVLPGDMLELDAKITQAGSRACKAHVEAKVDGKVVASADQMYVLAKA